mgnify:CR=1 FL=1
MRVSARIVGSDVVALMFNVVLLAFVVDLRCDINAVRGVKLYMTEPRGEIILYQSEDKKTTLQVRLEGETVWLTQAQMAKLFQTTVANINIHIHNIYDEGELRREATIKDSLIVQKEGSRQVSRRIEFYNLDVIGLQRLGSLDGSGL